MTAAQTGAATAAEVAAAVANAGDITSVIAGSSLTGGADSGDATLEVDPTQTQSRVFGDCAEGESIRTIHADGTVVCEVDDDSDSHAGIL